MNRKTIGLVLIGLSALAFTGSAMMKLFAPDEGMQQMGSNLVVLAIVELLIVAAIALPKTRLAGIYLGASYWGAVIAFQWLVEGEGAALPLVGIVLNTILFAGAALYYPSLMNGERRVAA